ncbi:hypothetical protein Nepgr_009153 [Nepenthes gracilis]|uniref:Uncharacterized protein n=1 Tax=Nepenthes gracilis TaxID=150966 RepID=A0AAD3SA49_NEPGR|nr:hypothetical protein Nepgr_009153 [Nepenthes gracilis]
MMTLPDNTAMWMPSETSMDLPQSPSTTQNSPSLERNSMNLVGEMDGDNRGKPVSEMDVPIIEEDGKDGADECVLILASPEGPPCSPTLTLPSNFPILTSSKTNMDISRRFTTTEISPSLEVMVGENQGKGQESMSSKMGLPVIEKKGRMILMSVS